MYRFFPSVFNTATISWLIYFVGLYFKIVFLNMGFQYCSVQPALFDFCKLFKWDVNVFATLRFRGIHRTIASLHFNSRWWPEAKKLFKWVFEGRYWRTRCSYNWAFWETAVFNLPMSCVVLWDASRHCVLLFFLWSSYFCRRSWANVALCLIVQNRTCADRQTPASSNGPALGLVVELTLKHLSSTSQTTLQ